MPEWTDESGDETHGLKVLLECTESSAVARYPGLYLVQSQNSAAASKHPLQPVPPCSRLWTGWNPSTRRQCDEHQATSSCLGDALLLALSSQSDFGVLLSVLIFLRHPAWRSKKGFKISQVCQLSN